MADVNDPASRLNDLLDQQELRIATVFRTAIAALKDDLDLDELADLIQQGRMEEAFGRLQEAADKVGIASNVAFVSAGQSTAEFLARANVGRVVFDRCDKREQHFQRHAGGGAWRGRNGQRCSGR